MSKIKPDDMELSPPPDAPSDLTKAVEAVMIHIVEHAEQLGIVFTDIRMNIGSPERVLAWYAEHNPNKRMN